MTTNALPVKASEFDQARKLVEKPVMRAIQRAARQIESFHRQQKQQSWIDTQRPGTMLGQLVSPVGAVGIYVPGGQGGQTPLVSSVLMGAVPANVAGVERIVLVTPPTKTGQINPNLLMAAKRAGIKEVYKVGGPWAIAALAYGTESIPKVDVIVGPGNQYVTLAKKLLFGTVGHRYDRRSQRNSGDRRCQRRPAFCGCRSALPGRARRHVFVGADNRIPRYCGIGRRRDRTPGGRIAPATNCATVSKKLRRHIYGRQFGVGGRVVQPPGTRTSGTPGRRSIRIAGQHPQCRAPYS